MAFGHGYHKLRPIRAGGGMGLGMLAEGWRKWGDVDAMAGATA